ncbi:hypothetical protein NCU07888 [Neurospora crassa OR74A]|uniref:DUF4112 domain-containing protein n=2 Tax=Neurospora TaxID=5140 RepID=Q7SB06_NEUCR|nr:hypothetical protein NCU07888 [Neurospora crassa OR74A]EAA33585.2 hypothetical protein NCU07888 [Neurospora crassa OR74A]KAK3494361.1 hypothetical protein B0T23DRAFT_106879 [Neurospora hispaniola]KAK3505282.1 hypothetical protein B0T13DRAFT_33802 [Neurospora crassa]|eukprot:XP_962821.2 hypothetical protein NCU07888 [Neurospora crassa OR74A]
MNVLISILGKRALKSLDTDKIKPNSDNPYEERVPVYKNGQIVKYRTQERPIPVELSSNDQAILKTVRKRAYKWDMGFKCCCVPVRFGWSFFIGLIPIIGDFADALMALWLVKKASKIDGGLPATLYAKMISNIMFDFAIGLIPIVGDIIDAVYRANTRNAWLLHVYLMAKADAVRNGKVSDPETGETIHLLGNGTGNGVLQPSTRPAQSTSAPKTTHGRGWGWNRGGGRTAEPDLESGIVEARPERELRDSHGGRGDGRGGSTRDSRSQGRR